MSTVNVRLVRARLQRLTRHGHHDARHAPSQGLSIDLGPTSTNAQGTRTHRLRKDGRTLPLPPVLDSIAIGAKQKWRKPKSDVVDEPLSEFQQELANNVYARALATPIRQCAVTFARLPSHFLVKYKALPVPEPTPVKSSIKPTSRELRISRIVQDDEIAERGADMARSSMYIGNNEAVMAWLKRKTNWQKVIPARIVEWHTVRNGFSLNNPHARKGFVWNDDVREQTLNNHRQAVVQALKEAGRSSALAPANEMEKPDCLLQLQAEDSVALLQISAPVYNLLKLLKSEDITDLLSTLSISPDTTALAMTAGELTTRTRLTLERLKAFHGFEP